MQGTKTKSLTHYQHSARLETCPRFAFFTSKYCVWNALHMHKLSERARRKERNAPSATRTTDPPVCDVT